VIVDSHVHVFPADRASYRFEPVAGQELPADATADRLIAAMDRAGVARAILVRPAAFARDGRYEREAVAAWPGRLAAIAALPLDPNDADVERAARELGAPGASGCRLLLVRGDALRRCLAGGFDPVCARAGELGLPVLVLGRHAQGLAAVRRLAGRYPATPFVIDHFAHVGPAAHADDEQALLDLSGLHNVHVKLALHHQLSSEDYPWADLHPLQAKLLAAYGAERLMWGSNFPMFLPDPTYQERLDAVRVAFPFASAEDRAMVLGGTAARLWPAQAGSPASEVMHGAG
jgi:predicted TIM-barrel fold metal-dependent hydrolase